MEKELELFEDYQSYFDISIILMNSRTGPSTKVAKVIQTLLVVVVWPPEW